MIAKMRSAIVNICIAAFAASALVGVANATEYSRSYRVEHPRYGNIGTYVYSVAEANGEIRTEAQLRVAVKVLGFLIYRQDADLVETFRGDTLISFQSVTTTNGKPTLVYGVARAGRFYVISTTGIRVAPAGVLPSDPWLLKRIGSGVVVSTKSGKVEDVEVSGGEVESVLLDGTPVPTRHFHVRAGMQPDKWEVWLDSDGSPVKFRSLENGIPIDFTFTSMDVPTTDLLDFADGSIRRQE